MSIKSIAAGLALATTLVAGSSAAVSAMPIYPVATGPAAVKAEQVRIVCGPLGCVRRPGLRYRPLLGVYGWRAPLYRAYGYGWRGGWHRHR